MVRLHGRGCWLWSSDMAGKDADGGTIIGSFFRIPTATIPVWFTMTSCFWIVAQTLENCMRCVSVSINRPAHSPLPDQA